MAERYGARWVALAVVATLGLIVAGLGTVAAAQIDSDRTVYTGCLNERSGLLTRVAIGDEPSRPCASRHVQISWDDAGPAFEDRIASLERRVAELEEPIGTLDLSVDCGAGDTIGSALAEAETHLGQVNITISGVCTESVNVNRDNVWFGGTERTDGIRGSVFLFEAQRIHLNNMTISGGTSGISAALGSTFTAADITVRDTSQEGIGVSDGSAAWVDDCMIVDNMRFGVHVNTEGILQMNNCEITGSGETGVFAGGVGSATIVVVGSEIVGNESGAGANPGGNLRLTDTLVANNNGVVGVFAIGGDLAFDGATRVVDNAGFLGGVVVSGGSNAYSQVGPVIIEGNTSDGITVDGGSSFRGDELIVRNNGGNGISVRDLSTVTVSPGPQDVQTQIVDNGGWGISCEGPPAVAIVGGQGQFNPNDLDLSGNALGPTSCQSP